MTRYTWLFLTVLLLVLGCKKAEKEDTANSADLRSAKAAPSGAGAEDSGEVTFVTYNVLADPRETERWNALLDIVEDVEADVVAFQEVTAPFIRTLHKHGALRDYHPTTTHQQPPGGLLTFSRSPWLETQVARFESTRQNRYLLVGRTRPEERDVAIANVHLDSPLESHEVRADQLDEAFALLGKFANEGADTTVLMGDFNFGDGEQPETSRLPPHYVDAWRALRGHESGFTWNMEQNPMARRGAFAGEPSRRLDRILIATDELRPSDVDILGDSPVKTGLFPSDHFGLSATLAPATDSSTP